MQSVPWVSVVTHEPVSKAGHRMTSVPKEPRSNPEDKNIPCTLGRSQVSVKGVTSVRRGNDKLLFGG